MPDTHRDEIEKLEALYASNPAGRVFTHLAEAYRKAGELTRAKEILDTGLERHPDYPSARVVLGRVMLDLGDKNAAVLAFRQVLELDRHNLVALRALGDLAVESGRFDEARHYFGELIQIDPGDLESADRMEGLPEEAEPTGDGSDARAAAGAAAFLGGWGDRSVEEPAAGVEGWGEGAEPDEGGEEADAVEAPPASPASLASEPEAPTAEEPAMPVWWAGPPPADETLEERVAAAERAREPERSIGRLEAWVESLNVLEPEPILPGLPDMVAGDLAAALPAEPEAEPETVEASWDAAPEPVSEALEAELAEPEAPAAESAATAEPTTWETAALEAEPPAGLEVEPAAWEPVARAEPPAALEAEPVAGLEVEPPAEPPAEPAEAGRPIGEATPEAGLDSVWWGDPGIHGGVPDPVEWVSQEDWERIAAYGAWSGGGMAEEAVEPVPRMETGWEDESRDEDADEVATETLAEVYAAQGFRAEAAEIYRKLLRRRPDDPRLLARLSALEEPARGVAGGAGFEAETRAEDAPASEAWLEHVEAAWPGSEELVVAGPTPYAWVESGAGPEPDAGATIGERLRDLLAWQPESAPEPEPEATITLDEIAAEPGIPPFPAFGAPPGRAPANRTGEPLAGEGEEDLEMFRSWLKSLRK